MPHLAFESRHAVTAEPAVPLRSPVANASTGAARAEPLLCLHSSGSSGRQWKALSTLVAPHLQVVAPHLLGYEEDSVWPTGRPVSLDAEAENMEAHLPPTGAHLFGHSYGGAVALQLALRFPARVHSLTLYEPVRFAMLFAHPATAEAIVSIGRRIGLDVISGSLSLAAARFVDYWSGNGAWQALDARHQQAIAVRMPKVQAEFEALFADRVPVDAYRTLTMPVRLLGGSRSPLPARQVLERLHTLLPHATRVTLSGQGHMAPVSAPAAVAGMLPSDWRRQSLAEAA